MQCSTGWLGARFGMEAQHEHHGRCEAVSMEARPPKVGQRTPVRTRRTVRPTTHTVMQTSATTCSRPQPPTAAHSRWSSARRSEMPTASELGSRYHLPCVVDGAGGTAGDGGSF